MLLPDSFHYDFNAPKFTRWFCIKHAKVLMLGTCTYLSRKKGQFHQITTLSVLSAMEIASEKTYQFCNTCVYLSKNALHQVTLMNLLFLLQFPSLMMLDGTSSYFLYLNFLYYRFYHVLGTVKTNICLRRYQFFHCIIYKSSVKTIHSNGDLKV